MVQPSRFGNSISTSMARVYPQAALFGFCVALIAYNVLAVIKAALRHVHGEEKIKNEVSGYYIAGEISRTYEGMSIAIEKGE